MSWGAIGAAAIGTAAGYYNSQQQKKRQAELDAQLGGLGTAEDAAGRSIEQAKQNELWEADQNRNSQLWADVINQSNLGKQTALNRADWSREGFGSGAWNADLNQYDITMDPSQRATLDALRGKQQSIISGMGGGFDVNGDVMQAYRGQQAPMLAEARNKENARLAAMGLGTGSGAAWGSAQDVLNRSENDANQKAILAGFQANQSLRDANRADLGALGSTESGILSGMNAPSYSMVGTTNVQAPTLNLPASDLVGAWSKDYNNILDASNAAGAGSAANAGGLAQGFGSMFEAYMKNRGNTTAPNSGVDNSTFGNTVSA